MKPKVFIGSSSESVDYARAVQTLLQADASCKVWDQDVCRLSKPTLQSLLDTSRTVDAAIFIFAPDDKLKIRGAHLAAARDNVVYELGLFSGCLDPQRCFVIAPAGTRMRIPSDLLGLTLATYDPQEKDCRMAVAAATNQIRDLLRELGTFSTEEAVLARDRMSPPAAIDAVALGGVWLSRFQFQASRHDGTSAGIQYNVERLEPCGSRTLIGHNVKTLSSNKREYRHALRLTIVKSHLTGRWFNINHESVGVFQLRVHSNRDVMEGLHLGDADDESVQMGSWE